MHATIAIILTLIGCAFLGLVTYCIPDGLTLTSPHAIDYIFLFAAGFIALFSGLLSLISYASASH